MSAPATVAIKRNPFPGLRPFREDEEYLFFGRENQVDAMVDKLSATHFLAVVGTSGSGKSSLVNCGLRPALHAGLMARAGTAWRVAQFRPGSDPVKAMARALAADGVLFRDYQADGLTLAEIVDTTLRMSSLGLIDIFEQAQVPQGENLLVVVDQFEELFRYWQIEAGQPESGPDVKEQATAFVNLLLAAAKQTTHSIYIVLTMRSDFLGDCTQFAGLTEAINTGQYLVPRMTRDERRAAISGPVEVAGAEMSPVLLTRLVNDVGDNPDQLSILQHALNRTWARWQHENASGPLNLAHYEAIGTMAHALDQHAELAYAELKTERQQQICKKLFQALTDKATDVRGVRRPTPLHTLCDLANATEAEVTEVIEVFREPTRSFLMPPAGESLEAQTVIDISHESLMRVWQRLIDWADEEARSAGIYRRLAETAELHAKGQASLWRDPDLQLALNWRDESQANETWASRYHPGFAMAMRFLSQSGAAREAERAERQAQQRRELEAQQEKAEAQARYARRMRWAALFSGALAVFAVITAGMAIHAQNQAEQQTAISNSGRLATASLMAGKDNRPDRASLLAVEALDAADTFDARNALLLALQSNPRVKTFFTHSSVVDNVALAPDGKILATASGDVVWLWLIEDKGATPLDQPLKGHTGSVTAIAFSQDGKFLASGSDDKTVRLWQPGQSGWTLFGQPLQGHEYAVTSVAFAPDGKTLASASDDEYVRLWRLGQSGWASIGDPLHHDSAVTSIAFRPDPDEKTPAPDEITLASGSWNKTVWLWQLDGTGSVLDSKKLMGHAGRVATVAFSPDGKTLASGSWDKTVRLWQPGESGRDWAADGPPLIHESDVLSVAFAPDEITLASGSLDQSIRLWRRNAGQWRPTKNSLTGHGQRVTSVAFAPNGKTLVSGSWDQTARLWLLDSKESQQSHEELKGHERDVSSVVFAPDGKIIASGSWDCTVRLWQRNAEKPTITGAVLGEYTQKCKNFVTSITFTPDGKTAATGSADATVQLWQRGNAGWTQVGNPLTAHSKRVTSVAFTADGKTLATASYDTFVLLWRSGEDGWTQFGEPLTGHTNAVNSVAFAPDGKTLASAGDDTTVQLWQLGAEGANVLGEPLTGHTEAVNSVAFAPDGKTLASASDDKTVRLWRTGKAGWAPFGEPLTGHTSAVSSVAFALDGITLASSSGDNNVQLWQLAKNGAKKFGEPLTGHTKAVNSVAFAPDGKTLASASEDKTVRLWPVGIETWRAAACRRIVANPDLTENATGRSICLAQRANPDPLNTDYTPVDVH